MPAFYNQPQTIDDLVNHSVGRVLDLFGLDAGILKRWEGPNGRPEKPSQETRRKRSSPSREPAGAK
jgi:4-hydroxy-3-polyprenylbenzoate decarboxylase